MPVYWEKFKRGYTLVQLYLYMYGGVGVYMAKKKLNLSIEEDLHKAIKHIAINQDTTVSSLIEDYIKAIQSNREIIRAIKDINFKK